MFFLRIQVILIITAAISVLSAEPLQAESSIHQHENPEEDHFKKSFKHNHNILESLLRLITLQTCPDHDEVEGAPPLSILCPICGQDGTPGYRPLKPDAYCYKIQHKHTKCIVHTQEEIKDILKQLRGEKDICLKHLMSLDKKILDDLFKDL
jgi:hypothetical protein